MKDDLISRQAAIDAVDDWWITVDDNRHPVSVIKALPSAQPEITDCDYCHEDSDGYVTPLEKNCHAFVTYSPIDGWILILKANGWHGEARIKFCPMCGRRLGGQNR